MSRREYFTAKYKEFTADVKEIVPTNIIPSLDDIDLVDALYFFEYTFRDEIDYERIVRQLVQYNGIKITEAQIQLLLPIFSKYIDLFKTIS